MKRITISLLVILLAASGLLMGCTLGDNPFPYISGSVTVADEADWPDLRLGVFYDSTGDFTTDYDFGETDYVYRAVYSDNDGWLVSSSLRLILPPAATISQTSGVNGTFRVDFDPEWKHGLQGFYYPIAWIDTTATTNWI